MDTVKAEQIIEQTLHQANEAVSRHFDADVFLLNSPMEFGLDDDVRDEIEGISERDGKKGKLLVILETPGGFIETVERIVAVFRRHYDTVEFLIPNFAYSAGTVLALSGDEIYMDYYSVLGPIDPQFRTENGKQVPGMGYIAKYRELIGAINDVPDDQTHTVKAELSFLLKKFDPAELFRVEQSIQHSKSLLTDWLPRFKFKGWKKTEARGIDVTEELKVERAAQIAEALGDAEKWHSHGRGISRADLAADEIGLKTVDFGADPSGNTAVRHYYGLFSDYMAKQGMGAATHSCLRLRRIG